MTASIPRLLPADIAATIPPLYASDSMTNLEAKAKLFAPWINWTWHLIEYDGEDICFGLVAGHEVELGCFSL